MTRDFIQNSQVLNREIDLFFPSKSILILNEGLNIDFSQTCY